MGMVKEGVKCIFIIRKNNFFRCPGSLINRRFARKGRKMGKNHSAEL